MRTFNRQSWLVDGNGADSFSDDSAAELSLAFSSGMLSIVECRLKVRYRQCTYDISNNYRLSRKDDGY
jgi:hypothetical protein